MAAALPAHAPAAAALAPGGAEPQGEVAQVLLDDLGPEKPDSKQMVYLVTISRVLPEVLVAERLRDVTRLSRAEVADFIRDALDNPIAQPRGGRPMRREGTSLRS